MACASPDCKSGPYVVNNVGSTPTSPTILPIIADVAQLVERTLHTGMVAGSSPAFGTKIARTDSA